MDNPSTARNILLYLSFNDLKRACQTNKVFYQICQDDSFWQDKYRHDFGSTPPLNGETYKSLYLSKEYPLVDNLYDWLLTQKW